MNQIARLCPWSQSAFLGVLLALALSQAHAEPSIDDYVRWPEVSAVAVSPSGRLLAMHHTVDGMEAVTVFDLVQQQMLPGVVVSARGVRRLLWLTDRFLITVAGGDQMRFGFADPLDNSVASILDIESGRYEVAPRNIGFSSIRVTGGTGNVVGVDAEGGSIFMAGQHLYRVSLTGSGRAHRRRRGTTHTINWLVDDDGYAILREDLNQQDNRQQFWAVHNKRRVLIYENISPIPEYAVVGTTGDRKHAVVAGWSTDTNARNVFLLDLESGDVSGPLFRHPDKTVKRVLTTLDRVVFGVEYAGFRPTYDFHDSALADRVNSLQAQFPDSVVRLESWSDDFATIVVYVSGGADSGAYYIAQGNEDAELLALSRPNIPRQYVARVDTITYPTTDGQSVPALLTASDSTRETGRAPLVVLAPWQLAGNDEIEFDWLAQYLAYRGYVVLQPQVRGSASFGYDYFRAGYGEWADRMQADIADGIAHLVGEGQVDPDRVCILGFGYGGYRALWAASTSPEQLACAVSVNGAGDMRELMERERIRYGRYHWALTYWEYFLGVSKNDNRSLYAMSPKSRAHAIDASILLIHDIANSYIRDEQSREMYARLKSRGKDARLVLIDSRDREMDGTGLRSRVLEEIDRFLAAHLDDDGSGAGRVESGRP